jgi:hypothetical protein
MNNTNGKSQIARPITTTSLVLICLMVLALRAGAEAPTLTGRWEKIVPLHPGVFSIALGTQILHIPGNAGKPQESEFLLKSLAELSPPILRLPGGDVMNTWSYRTGALHEAELLKLASAGHSIPLWGVNVTTASPAETEAFATALAREHADTSYFELGNELYLPRWAAMTKTASIYAEKAAPHAALLKQRFPKAKLGVPLASYWMLQDPNRLKETSELRPWITGLARETNFYDAVVLHLYLVPTDLGPSGLATHSADEVRRWVWSRSDASQIRAVFGLVHGMFPDKEIWVTEWAFNASQYISRNNHDVRYQVHQTMLAVLYNARFMLNTASYVPYVPIMTLWTLYGQPPVALLRDNRTTINYELFRLIRAAREGADGLAHLPLGDETADAFGFFRAGVLHSVLILNCGSKPRHVEIPSLPASGLCTARTLFSDEMLPNWGNPANPSPAAWSPPYRLEELQIERRRVTVPPNSISLVEVAQKESGVGP